MAKNNKGKQVRPGINDAVHALDAIHEKYKKLPLSDIEKFAPVYYPIAIIEMNVDEKTFEDFESVQYAILHLFSIGISDHKVIAETLGLSLNYVFKIIRLLTSYGHLDDEGITPIGLDSIHSGQKIIKSTVWQKFQVDALNGTLLTIKQTITENVLNEKNKTIFKIGHLDYLDGVSVKDITSQLTKADYSTYIKQKSSILHANVIAIKNVRFIEITYAKCYMMKVRKYADPIVFAKRYDSTQQEIKDRFSWQPLSIENKEIQDAYEFENDIPYSTKIARQYTSQLFELIMEEGEVQEVDSDEKIIEAMKYVYPFEEAWVEIVDVDDAYVVHVHEHAFMRYSSWIVDFLMGLRQDGQYLLTHEKQPYGNVISLRSERPLVLEVAELLGQRIDKYGKVAISKRLKNKYNGYHGDIDIITLLKDELKTIVM